METSTDITVVIDGDPVACPADATVIQAIHAAGSSVPTLCHHASLEPVGACRVCVVEATWSNGRSGLVPACSTPVAPDMEIATASDAVVRSRRLAIELLLTRAPRSERILALAHEHGLVESRFPALVEPDECVLCGLCVRVCAEQVGREAITFAGRSVERSVTGAFGRPSSSCFACGSCVHLCPTRVLRFDDDGDTRRLYLGDRLLSENTLERCTVCNRPFATEDYLEWVEANADQHTTIRDRVCPHCARQHQAERIVRPMRVEARP